MPIRIAAAGLGRATHSVPRGLARRTGCTLRVDIEGWAGPQLPVSAADEIGGQVAAALAGTCPTQAASPGSAARPRPDVLTPNQDSLAAVARGRPFQPRRQRLAAAFTPIRRAADLAQCTKFVETLRRWDIVLGERSLRLPGGEHRGSYHQILRRADVQQQKSGSGRSRPNSDARKCPKPL